MLGNQLTAILGIDIPGLAATTRSCSTNEPGHSEQHDSHDAMAEIQVGQRGRDLVIQEQEAPILPAGSAPIQAPQNQPELSLVPRPEVPHGQPVAHLPEQPIVLPYSSPTSKKEKRQRRN
ncbi:hypothetical protein L3X38_042632 [Prunus dulcis]|uniref:Uncharacterized protein n=1 Tax=Prunus dulcis TaxID=3755 RepID=A0AAD4UWZ9_PRUDU|nr:hypothetical protein L3X38_042632 [Prunus dulcis]